MNHSKAEVNIGFCFEHGLGVERNLLKCRGFYERSVTQKNSGGIAHYALCLHFGIGFDEDVEYAAEHYNIAFNGKSSVLNGNSFRCLRIANTARWRKSRTIERPAEPEKSRIPSKSTHPYQYSKVIENCRTSKLTSPGGKVIGEGGSAIVTKEHDPISHNIIAVKRFHRHNDRASLNREVESLVKLKHPRIIRILRWSDSQDSNFGEIHMELAPKGSLRSLLESHRCGRVTPLNSVTYKAVLICDIVMGMRYVHSQGVIHRDLKPSNILLDANWRAKISDFGLSGPISGEGAPTGYRGTLGYAAPEQLTGHADHTLGTDVFAFGLILYEIIGGEAVFGRTETQKSIITRLRKRQFPAVPNTFGPLMQNLIPRCCAIDPRSRPSFDSIFTEFQDANFDILPGIDAAYVKRCVEEVLALENQEADSKM
jgi:hypothetical protein